MQFGTANATNVNCSSTTQCTVTSPAGTAGTTVDVTVTVGGQTSAVGTATKFTYTSTSSLGQITSPTPGSTLSGSTVTFQWSSGAGAQGYWLYVGSTGVGSYNIHSSSEIPTGTLSRTVSNVPTSGTIYVRLYTKLNGIWTTANSRDYTYSGSTAAAGESTAQVPEAEE